MTSILFCGITILSSCHILLHTRPRITIPTTLSNIKPDSSDCIIKQATIHDNMLELDIEYIGDKQTTFELIGSEAISKSLPPQRNVQLILNTLPTSRSKTCRVILEADISKFAYRSGASNNISLNIVGYSTLNYTYKIK